MVDPQRRAPRVAGRRTRSCNPIGRSSRPLGRKIACALASDQWDRTMLRFLGRIEGWHVIDPPRTSILVDRPDSNVGFVFFFLSNLRGEGKALGLVPTNLQLHRLRYGSGPSIGPDGDGLEAKGKCKMGRVEEGRGRAKVVDEEGILRVDDGARKRSIHRQIGLDDKNGEVGRHAIDEQMDKKRECWSNRRYLVVKHGVCLIHALSLLALHCASASSSCKMSGDWQEVPGLCCRIA